MIKQYIQLVGEDEVDAVVKWAERLQDLSILYVNSTAAWLRSSGLKRLARRVSVQAGLQEPKG